MKGLIKIFALMAAITFSHAAWAEDAAEAGQANDFPYLTGDWGGERAKLVSAGIDLQANYTADYWSNLSGGIHTGSTFQDNLDLTMAIDGEKLYGLQGSKIWIYFLNNSGSEFNKKHVGSGEGVDNIEVNTETFKLFEAWVEQNFWGDVVSLRGGLYNLNSEFDATESSAIFLNPTYGIDTAYAGTGVNGPSVFPTSSLAARLKIAPTEKSYLMAAILDGVPGSPANPHGTHIDLGRKDGMLVAAEAGYGDLDGGRIGVGGWRYSAKADHLSQVDDDGNPVRGHSHGAYIIMEKTLYHPGGDADRHLDGFIRFARGNEEVNQFLYSGSVGLAYTGPLESRKEDVAGLTFHGARNGSPYRSAAIAGGSPVETGEWGTELTYSAQVTPWLSVQPDVQYIRDPGTNPLIEEAVIAGLRTKVSF
jgi:porin